MPPARIGDKAMGTSPGSVSVFRRIAAAAVVFATGCFSIPPYQPKVSVSYTDEAGGGGTANGPGFALHFASTGFHFPDALMIDDVDVLGHAMSPACDAEDGAGFQFLPTPRISAGPGAMTVTNRLVPVLRGPAVVQLKLDWASQFPCMDGSSVLPNGSSTFTVFPDGRIVRDDMLADPNPPGQTPPVAGNCNCDSGTMKAGFTISSYWTFAQENFQNLYMDPTMPAMLTTLPIMDKQEFPDLSTACIAGDKSRVGFAWPTTDSTTIHGAGTLIAFGRDNIINNTGELTTFPWENSLAMFIERGGSDCSTTLVRASAYNMPPMSALSINGGLPPISASVHDGIYGGAGDNGPPGVVLTSDQVTLTGTVAGSFAVWLRFPHAVDTLRATLANATGAWYVPQQVDDHSWIVWFRDALSSNQMITIEPN